MPKETFYGKDAVEGDAPHLVVAWGTTEVPKVLLDGEEYDRSGLNRLIATLRRARNQVYGKDE